MIRAIDLRTDAEKEADRKKHLLENYCPVWCLSGGMT